MELELFNKAADIFNEKLEVEAAMQLLPLIEGEQRLAVFPYPNEDNVVVLPLQISIKVAECIREQMKERIKELDRQFKEL